MYSCESYGSCESVQSHVGCRGGVDTKGYSRLQPVLQLALLPARLWQLLLCRHRWLRPPTCPLACARTCPLVCAAPLQAAQVEGQAGVERECDQQQRQYGHLGTREQEAGGQLACAQGGGHVGERYHSCS